MCYHYGLKANKDKLHKRIPAKNRLEDWSPIFHVNAFSYPMMPVLNASMEWEWARWGLLPAFVKSSEDVLIMRSKTLNARFETLADKASFKQAFSVNRCLIPATHFMEWQHQNTRKIPYLMEYPQLDIFFFGGLKSDFVHPQTGIRESTFSIVTTEAISLLASIHNSKKRKPVVLKNEGETAWLQKAFTAHDLAWAQVPEDEWTTHILPSNPANWDETNPPAQLELF